MWWILKNGAKTGPFARDKIELRLRLGMIGPMDKVSEDGKSWTMVRDTDLWQQERTIPEEMAMPAPNARRKIAVMQPGTSARARANSATLALHGAQTTDGGNAAPSQDGQGEVGRVRQKMSGKIIALISVLGTLSALFIIIMAIGIFSGDGGTYGGEAPNNGGLGQDDGFRGEEIGSLNVEYFRPEYRDLFRYICPTYGEMKQTFAMIENSAHVTDNYQYQDALSQVHFYCVTSNDEVNAYATWVDQNREELWPTMIVQGGLGRFSRIVGAVLAEFGNSDKVDEKVGLMFVALGSSLAIDLENAAGFLCDNLEIPLARFSDEAWLANAKNISRGVLLSVLAHEAGHIALGHIYGWSKNLERSRNQEREADSFAHSVASGTADADNMFWGNYIFNYAYALFESMDPNSEIARTHPFSEERLCNLIRDNQSIARKYGFSEEGVRKDLADTRKAISQ